MERTDPYIINYGIVGIRDMCAATGTSDLGT